MLLGLKLQVPTVCISFILTHFWLVPFFITWRPPNVSIPWNRPCLRRVPLCIWKKFVDWSSSQPPPLFQHKLKYPVVGILSWVLYRCPSLTPEIIARLAVGCLTTCASSVQDRYLLRHQVFTGLRGYIAVEASALPYIPYPGMVPTVTIPRHSRSHPQRLAGL